MVKVEKYLRTELRYTTMAGGSSLAYDMVIVGQGPAAITAAIVAMNSSYKILLIGSERLVSRPTIESMHPGVISLMKKLGIGPCPDSIILGTYSAVTDFKNAKSLNPYSTEGWSGLHVRKDLFSKHLFEEAYRQNVEMLIDTVTSILYANNRVTGVQTAGGKKIAVRYVIDASGSRRVAGKVLRFKEEFHSQTLVVWSGVSRNCIVPSIPPSHACFFAVNHGWTWICPLKNGEYYWTQLAPKKKATLVAPSIVATSPYDLLTVSNMRWRIFRPLAMDGLLLCGDAAFLIDPSAGTGVFHAMMTGMKAAQAALAAIENSNLRGLILAEYDNSLYEDFLSRTQQIKEVYDDLGVKI